MSTTLLRLGVWLLVSVCGTVAVSASAATDDFLDEQEEVREVQYGVVERLDLANNRIVIGGLTYHVPLDAEIEINGGPGALSMLDTDMKVRMTFRHNERGERELTSLQTVDELPGEYLS